MGEHIHTDLLVIGGGSGGLSVAAGAVQMGAKVVLLEAGKMGGDCLNYGCVPSKALLSAAKHAHAMTSGAPFGVAPREPEVDFAAAKDHVEGVIAAIAPHDSQERFEGLGVRVIRAHGRFVSRDTVDAGDTRISARRIVIATGSRPFVPPIPGIEATPHETNETIFDLRERPRHLLIVGGGPIGIEMAQAHLRLGCQVTVLEAATALGKDDPEAAALVLERLRAEGARIVEEAKVTSVEGQAGAVRATLGDGSVHEGTHLLIAVGRTPGLEALNLEAAGVRYDRGGVKVNASLRTSNRRIYAIGDAAGGLQFTHVAGYHGGIVVRQAVLGLPAKAETRHIPRVTYTDPELAQIGPTEAEARKDHGRALEVVRVEFSGNDRALAEGRPEGFLKVMVLKGRPIGATLVGAQAGELIGVWALAIANRMKMSALTSMVAPYPTRGEISKRAAGQYYAPKLFESDVVKRVVRLVQRF